MVGLAGGGAALPPVERLELHVDGEICSQFLTRDVPLRNLRLFRAREDLAKQLRRRQHAKRLPSVLAALPWEHLLEKLKEAFR